jgi:hypothetical protein
MFDVGDIELESAGDSNNQITTLCFLYPVTPFAMKNVVLGLGGVHVA